MTASEPTTGELIEQLHTFDNVDAVTITIAKAALLFIADRLESQEAQINQLCEALAYANEWHKESVENATNELRELSGITGELERFRTFHERYAEQTSKKYIDDICALTARAEQAELARDILCGTIRDMEEPKTVGSSTFTIERRGLSQDGEGKNV